MYYERTGKICFEFIFRLCILHSRPKQHVLSQRETDPINVNAVQIVNLQAVKVGENEQI